ncbi:hypothetical protein, partial [Frankia sp. Cj3]|uniref:hypothetical protein n=1 Tax=Frankia sp. Cj3 TaxID=2880976 RepID=UPI001EF603D0
MSARHLVLSDLRVRRPGSSRGELSAPRRSAEQIAAGNGHAGQRSRPGQRSRRQERGAEIREAELG